jgi:hypothetical protein
MQSQTGSDSANAVLKYKVMIIDTAELKKLLEDKDLDGITFQFSQDIVNSPQDRPKLKLIAYKHFPGRRSEQITNPKFFVEKNDPDFFKEIEVGDDGVTSHFGNLQLRRSDLKEEADTSAYPYLVLWPEEGTGDYNNYIVYEAFYTNNLNDTPPHKQTLSRGVSTSSTMSLKPINPSPPA